MWLKVTQDYRKQTKNKQQPRSSMHSVNRIIIIANSRANTQRGYFVITCALLGNARRFAFDWFVIKHFQEAAAIFTNIDILQLCSQHSPVRGCRTVLGCLWELFDFRLRHLNAAVLFPSKQIRNLTYSYYIPRRNIIRLVLEEPSSPRAIYIGIRVVYRPAIYPYKTSITPRCGCAARVKIQFKKWNRMYILYVVLISPPFMYIDTDLQVIFSWRGNFSIWWIHARYSARNVLVFDSIHVILVYTFHLLYILSSSSSSSSGTTKRWFESRQTRNDVHVRTWCVYSYRNGRFQSH